MNNINQTGEYVSKGGHKLASVSETLKLDFKNKIVLDIGSSTGGFTDYALKQGAKKVIAVEIGTDQMRPELRANPRVELHEKTDVRNFTAPLPLDIILIDVSFISIEQILPAVKLLCTPKTFIVAMVKPQFETSKKNQKNRGVIKNERIRRQILKDFENWVQKLFKVVSKADSKVTGDKGNIERFYVLKVM